MEERENQNRNEEIVFALISFSGDARSYTYEALNFVKQGKYAESEKALEEAQESITKAHNIQTALIQQEAMGNHVSTDILMVHAQDHLMTTLLAKDLITNMIGMQKELNELKEKAK